MAAHFKLSFHNFGINALLHGVEVKKLLAGGTQDISTARWCSHQTNVQPPSMDFAGKFASDRCQVQTLAFHRLTKLGRTCVMNALTTTCCQLKCTVPRCLEVPPLRACRRRTLITNAPCGSLKRSTHGAPSYVVPSCSMMAIRSSMPLSDADDEFESGKSDPDALDKTPSDQELLRHSAMLESMQPTPSGIGSLTWLHVVREYLLAASMHTQF
eukprot:1973279-Amphidinium_carterae.1